MRVLLFTGKGGVGKTTCAAATAAQLAAKGHRTLLISVDPNRSLADICGVSAGPEPAEIAAGLYVAQFETQRSFEASWQPIQTYLGSVLAAAGAEPLDEAELTTFTGADELLALLEVQSQASSGRWDALVVDCGTAAQAVRMLRLPATLAWYLERLLPLRRNGLRARAAPDASRPDPSRPDPSRPAAAGAALPRARAFEAMVELHANLRGLAELLADGSTTSVRLVVTPEAVVVADALRTLTALSLHGFAIDGVIVNRVSAGSGCGADREGGRLLAERRQLAVIEESFEPRAIRRAPHLSFEPTGVEALHDLASQVFADADPLTDVADSAALRLDRGVDTFVLSLALPLVERGEIDLVRRGDELVVTVQGQRRVLTLPSALRRCVVTNASLADGRLGIDFAPDPDLWMRP